jgi:hypothetical protein
MKRNNLSFHSCVPRGTPVMFHVEHSRLIRSNVPRGTFFWATQIAGLIREYEDFNLLFDFSLIGNEVRLVS